MNALEREIIEKFHQLKPAAEVEQTDISTFDYDAWFRDVESLRQQIRASQGDKLPSIDVIGILRDIRENC